MMGIRERQIAAVTSMLLAFVLLPDVASAHGVFGKDALFLQNLQGRAIGPLMYLGAKHMVTGYDPRYMSGPMARPCRFCRNRASLPNTP